MKKPFIFTAVIVLVAGFGAYSYLTRPAAVPSQDITEAVATSSVQTGTVYRIGPTDSKVSFSIKETLRDKPFTAVGITNQIAGDVIVKTNSIQTGEIKINARTFKTDSSNRDGAIAHAILKSDDAANEFISIAPITASVSLIEGKTTSFTATTTVTIAGVSKSVPFSVIIKAEGAKLAIVASATIKRSDFGLTIPNIPFVANVDDAFPVNAMMTAVK